MRGSNRRLATRFAMSASVLAIAGVPLAADAQDASSTLGNPGPSRTDQQPAQQPATSPTQSTNDPKTDTGDAGDVVVTGVRASLQASLALKRDSQGIVDAISAEDIGKFPDTNLAESLQRITGVSIDRSNGEGQFITVRGFGPEFNLVTLNGRQMPTSSLGDGASAPSSRAFDFANLASEGIAAVEVYKSGRASVPSGGIGSTVNIRTPRPLDKQGLRGSLAVKGVADTTRNSGVPITPEVSGIISDTFADGKIGILLNGIYQKRKASVNTASVGYRDGYLGSENNWGSLAQGTRDATGALIDPRFANITNRPGPNDVYQVPQNVSYDFADINRERINGQAVLQLRPIESLTATIDYTYSRNTVEVRDSSVGIWFNHNNTSSAWTNGPAAGPIFYSEHFNQNEGKDLAYSGALTANRSENKSLGGNLSWKGPGGVTVTLDAHHSTAESKPSNNYGTSVSLGNAVFGISDQSVNFDNYIPAQSYKFYPGVDPLNAANIVPTGNAFRNAYFKDRINQVQLSAHYDHGGSLLDSLDFGASYVDNAVRSAYGYYQNDTWGGAGTAGQAAAAASIPDNVFQLDTVRDKFAGLGGVDTANIISQYYKFNFETEANLIKSLYNVCGPGGANASCLAPYNQDRRINERTIAPFLQVNTKFDLFGMTTHLIGGLRYEYTQVNSSALVPVPGGTAWVSANEFDLLPATSSTFTTFKGHYDNWLPSVDFDIQPIRGVKLRASYSQTISRAGYSSLQGGQTLDTLFRIANGTGSRGNPGLLPYKSKNIDLSAEFYYGKDDYISVGYFHKNVSNFIGSTRVNTTAFGLTNPASGPRYRAAIASLGANASTTDIRNYIARNYPSTVNGSIDPTNGNFNGQIFGLPEDDPLVFQIGTPINNSQTATLHGFEFAIQHNFWNTGFGTILNYTKVDGSARFNNTLPATITQFALPGLSDSANAVAFYDKNGFQARVAYNWRASFLAGYGVDPVYTASYGQVDANASYEFRKGFTGFFEIINANSASRRGYTRTTRNVAFAVPQSPRYSLGARFAF